MIADGLGKTNNIDVSIVVAVRNEEAYINKCLDSLLNQNFPREKYEIIVVDGMSDDRTREVLDLYGLRSDESSRRN